MVLLRLWKFEYPDNQEYAVIWAATPEAALEQLVKSREAFDIDPDLSHWVYEEFTPDMYDGCLYYC